MSKSKAKSNIKTEAPRRRGQSVLKKVLDIEPVFIDDLILMLVDGCQQRPPLPRCGSDFSLAVKGLSGTTRGAQC